MQCWRARPKSCEICGCILTPSTWEVGLDSQWVLVKTSWNHSELSLWLQLSLAHVQWMQRQLTCISDPNLFLFIMSGHQLLLCCLKYTVCPWTSTFSFQEDDLDFVHGLPNQQATSYFWTSDRLWEANHPPTFGEIDKVKYEKHIQGLIKWKYWSMGPQFVWLPLLICSINSLVKETLVLVTQPYFI